MHVFNLWEKTKETREFWAIVLAAEATAVTTAPPCGLSFQTETFERKHIFLLFASLFALGF